MDRAAERHLGERYCDCREDRSALALELRIIRDLDSYQEISSRTAVGSGLARAAKTYCLTVINACRDRYLEALLGLDIAETTAVRALLLDHLARAAAFGAGGDCLHLAEERIVLGHRDLASASAA